MKYLLGAILICSIFIACNSLEGSGKIITEKRTVTAFTAIKVGGAFEVEATMGSATSLTVEADDNIVPLIETYVNGSTLYIKTKGINNISNGHVKIFITTPVLVNLDCSGAADVKVVNPINYNGKIVIESSGASNISASINAPQVQVAASGAGKIELTGSTKDYNLKISGASDVKSSGLRSENTDVHVSGAGNAYVHASVFLKATSSGAGTIYYTGAARVDEHVSGAGTIKKEL
jgi:Putative auto-transporter adhesin, head GIN domain